MTRGLLLGLAYGFTLGVFARGLLDWAEASARNARRTPTPARLVTLTGRIPA